MNDAGSVLVHRPELDEFLQASIGEDGKGMSLTVLSALARQGLDPWQEADRLAQLPRDAAAQKLASLISGLPQASETYLDPEAIAARLIELLPGRSISKSNSVKMPFSFSSMTRPPAVFIFIVLIAIMLFAEFAFGGHH